MWFGRLGAFNALGGRNDGKFLDVLVAFVGGIVGEFFLLVVKLGGRAVAFVVGHAFVAVGQGAFVAFGE